MNGGNTFGSLFLSLLLVLSVIATGTGPLANTAAAEVEPTSADADSLVTAQEPDSTRADTDAASSNRTTAASSDGPIALRNEVFVGETVAIGFLEDHEGDTYEWEVVNGDDEQLLHASTAELDTASESPSHDARVTSFRPTESGEFDIAVTVDGTDRYTRTITVRESDSYLAGKSRHELVQRYSPVLNFHPNEKFHPARYEAYVENSNLNLDSHCPGDKTLLETATLLDIGADYAPNEGGGICEGSEKTTTHEETYLTPKTRGVDEHAAYQTAAVRDLYPETVYASVHENVEFRGETYTAIGYWMFYIHDPKPEDAPTRTTAAAHTGDQEPVFVLIDQQGDPQWIAAQQHRGGELRKWDRVETADDNRPVMYVAEGAHSNFFGPDSGDVDAPSEPEPYPEDLEYLYQQQYLCDGGGGPPVCSADGAGDPVLAQDNSGGSTDYTDYIDAEYPDATDVWRPETGSGIDADETYEVTLLTGDEPWGEYDGNVYRYPRGVQDLQGEGAGSFPMNQGRWEDDTRSDRSLTEYIDYRTRPGQQIEVHPDGEQIDGSIGALGGDRYAFNGTPNAKRVTLENTGLQPHKYVVTVTTTDRSSGATTTEQYAFLTDVGDVDKEWGPGRTSEIVPEERTVDVPLSAEGSGPWDVETTLSVYPEDVGTGQLERRYDLDSETFTVSDGPEGSLEIADVPDGDAGGADTPRPVRTTVRMLRDDGLPYNEPIETDRLEVAVGDRTVENRVLAVKKFPGVYDLHFVPPTQSEAGEYDLEVSYDGVGDTRANAISYGEGETTQLAASLQIDRSGSMSGIMDEAKEGAVTFVEQGNDDDYVSVVSYSSSSSVDQELVQLGEGREDVIGAIQGLSAGGSTNIGDAMSDGRDTLEDAPDGSVQAGIHMTDGRRNSGPSESRIINDIVPEYNERGACLYTIGFTDGADEAFMQDVAQAADCGEYYFAGEEGEVDSIQDTLQAVFLDIAGDVSDADLISTITGVLDPNDTLTDRFSVDESVVQMTTNIRLEGAELTDETIDENEGKIQTADVDTADAERVELRAPDGTAVSESDPDVEVSVVGDSLIYRIDDPEPGNWSYTVRNERSDAAEYSVVVTGDAQVTVDATASETTYVGDEADLTATVVGSQGGVGNATVDAEITAPDGATRTVALEEESPGVYSTAVEVAESGSYTASVNAERGELTRSDTVTWTVEDAPPTTVEQLDSPAIVQGDADEFDIAIERGDAAAAGNEERIVLESSALEAVDGNATRSELDLGRDSITLAGEGDEATVSASVSVPDDAPAGEYEATVRALLADGSTTTERVTVTVLESAAFELDVVETPDRVEAGDGFDATVDVENVGDVADEQTIAVGIPSAGYDSTTVSLAGGESTTETFSLSTPDDDGAGTYVATAASDDALVTRTVEVRGDDHFGVTLREDTSDTTVSEGDEATLNATVVNAGDRPGEQNVTLEVDGSHVNTTSVALDANESESVTWTTGSLDSGTRVATVSSENTTDEATIRVEDEDDDDDDDDDDDSGSASFDIAIELGADPAATGGELAVNATVENTGEKTGTRDLELLFDDRVATTTTVTLESGERTATTLVVDTSDVDPGEYDVELRSDDDADTATVDVIDANETASVAVSIVETNAPLEEGESLEVVAAIENLGDAAGTQSIELDVGERTSVDDHPVTLAGGERDSITLSYETRAGDAGDREVVVRSGTDSDAQTVVIDDSPASEPEPEPDEPGERIPGFGVVAALLAVLIAASVARRRS